MRIKTSQLVRYNDLKISLPRIGDSYHAKTGEFIGQIADIRLIGKPKQKLHLGQFPGLVQELELVILEC